MKPTPGQTYSFFTVKLLLGDGTPVYVPMIGFMTEEDAFAAAETMLGQTLDRSGMGRTQPASWGVK